MNEFQPAVQERDAAIFREMRRGKQALSQAECREILRHGTSGVLALAGDGGYPYAVPLSYTYQDGKIYFHCAKSGHKLDALRREPKASFCVIAQDQVVPEEYTTYYRSVIAFGAVREMEDGPEKQAAVGALMQKYYPEDSRENREKYIHDSWAALCMLEFSIEHLTGKECIELTRRKK